MSIESALKRPFQDIKTLLIGSGISLISMFIFITFPLLSGYMLECVRKTFKKDDSLPEWGNWGKLFVDGIKVMVIQVVYAIPALIVMAVTFGGALVGLLAGGASSDPTALIGAIATAGVGFLVTFIVAVISGLFSLVGTLRFAQTGVFGDAFKFSEIKPIALTWKLFGTTIIAGLIGTVVVSLLGILPIVGIGLGIFVAYVFQYTMYAEAYMGLKSGPSRTTRAPSKTTRVPSKKR